jgi:hypothetical protein
MPKERLYIADSGSEPSVLTDAQAAFFRYQYTLGSYEYACQNGSADEAAVLGQELSGRYEAYKMLRDEPHGLDTLQRPEKELKTA